jgi:hypothetical protein
MRTTTMLKAETHRKRVPRVWVLEQRFLEQCTWAAIAAEFREMGHDIEADQLRWAADEFRNRMTRARNSAESKAIDG